LEGFDGTCRLASEELCGCLLGPEVAGDPPVGKDPNSWCRECPATVGFFIVEWALEKSADVSGVTGTGCDTCE
jgi:hypothetical protein